MEDLKNNIVVLILVIAGIFMYVLPLHSQIKNDSLRKEYIKNIPKSYNWDSLKKIYPAMSRRYGWMSRAPFENFNLDYYSQKGFKYLYDSLATIYTPFKFYHIEGPCCGETSFYFLIDSCRIYQIILFLPETISIPSSVKTKKQIFNFIMKQKNFAVLAFKNDEYYEIKDKFGEEGTKKKLTNKNTGWYEYYREFFKLREKIKKK